MFTNQMRMTGFSGLDVQDIVSQMMRAESMRLHRFQGQRQILAWQQEQLRGVGSSILNFRNSWMNTRAPANQNIRLSQNFTGLGATITNAAGQAFAGVSVNAGATARAGNHTLDVRQIATAEAFRTSAVNPGAVSSGLALENLFTLDEAGGNSTLGNLSFNMTVNNQSRQISFTAAELRGVNSFVSGALDTIANQHGAMVRAQNTLAGGAAQAVIRQIETDVNTYMAENHAGLEVGSAEYNAARDAQRAYLEGERSVEDGGPTIAELRNTISNAENAIAQANAGIAQDQGFINALNFRLGVAFGNNANDPILGEAAGQQRVQAFVENGNLVIRASQGNNATIAANAGALGLQAGSTALRLDTSLADFLGLGDAETFQFTITQSGRTETISFDNLQGENAATLQDFMREINNSGLDVRMSFNATSGQFTIESTQTGENSRLQIGNFSTDGGTTTTDVFPGAPGSGLRLDRVQEGQNAIFSLNGGDFIDRETNTFTEQGMTITITQAAAEAGQININLSTDTSATRQLIENFVNAYNEIVRELQELTNTRRPRQGAAAGGGFFAPLTDEQRNAMSENEIRLWEEQAQRGLLNRDSMLRSILSEMRQEMSRSIRLEDGSTFSLASMGIRLSQNPNDGGILVFNEDANRGTTFTQALENNIEQITALFTGQGVASVSGLTGANAVSGANAGLGARLDGILNSYISEFGTGRLADRAGVEGRSSEHNNDIQRLINAQDRRIDTTLRWLERRENQLFAQFSRLEVAMMQANQQMMFWDSIMWGQ